MKQVNFEKLIIDPTPKFLREAQRLGVHPAYLAELACEVLANKPPVEIRWVNGRNPRPFPRAAV